MSRASRLRFTVYVLLRCDVAGKGLRGDRGMRGVPARHSSLEQEHLGRLVDHAGPRRDRLGQRPLRQHIDPIGGKARVLAEKGFDPVQGRVARGSGRAMFVDQEPLGLHQLLHIALALDLSHASVPLSISLAGC